ncbi:MAG: RES family NAD+ phosphorylase [Terracidiphilus sp.]
MISLFRLSSAKFPANSGDGAAKYGGRWNAVGTPVIYAAQTASLAALEVLVHFSAIPRDFILTEILVPENLAIVRCEAATLPVGWNANSITAQTQALGQAWIQTGRSAILSVPSSVIPTERNFILNPAHPAFRRIRFQPSVPFDFDPRLK